MVHLKVVLVVTMMLTLFIPSYVYAENELVQQLIDEARELGLEIDQSKIITKSTDEDGDFAGVPLSSDPNLKVTSKEISNGQVYVTLQCMKTKTLSGCYRVRITGVLDGTKGLALALVNRDGEVVTTSQVAPLNEQRVKRLHIVLVRGPVSVYIDGVYCGTYGFVIIIMP